MLVDLLFDWTSSASYMNPVMYQQHLLGHWWSARQAILGSNWVPIVEE